MHLHYVCTVHDIPKQLTEVQRMLQDELPEDNYNILKTIVQFLVDVGILDFIVWLRKCYALCKSLCFQSLMLFNHIMGSFVCVLMVL